MMSIRETAPLGLGKKFKSGYLHYREYWSDPLHFYTTALAICAFFQILHLVALPIGVTWDGYLYVDMAEMLGSDRFPGAWDFLRTPLFPLALKITFAVFGQSPMAVVALNSFVGFVGIWALGSAVKRAGAPRAAGLGILLLSFYPILITYQHMLLTDVWTFCLLCLILNVMMWYPKTQMVRSGAIVTVVTLAFYTRPNLLYLAPAMAGIEFFRIFATAQPSRDKRLLHASLHFLVIAALPFILAMPWKRLSEQSAGREGIVLSLGLVNQLVIPPEDPMIGIYKEQFHALINKSLLATGRLPMDGVGGGAVQVFSGSIPELQGKDAFVKAVQKYPLRYAKGVIRTTLIFLGWPGSCPENRHFREWIAPRSAGESIRGQLPPGQDPANYERFWQKTDNSLVARVVRNLNPLYDTLPYVVSILCLAGFVIGSWRLDFRLVVLTGVPFAFVAMHAFALQSADRYALPNLSIFIFSLFAVPQWIWQGRERHASVDAKAVMEPVLTDTSATSGSPAGATYPTSQHDPAPH